jgi:hypothetical protein
VRRRRTWRSLAGRCGAEEARALEGEAMGGGGRGARRWRGGVRRSRKRRSPTREAQEEGGRGARSGGAGSGRRHGVGQSGGRGGHAQDEGTRGEGRGVGQFVGPLGTCDRSLVHHPR